MNKKDQLKRGPLRHVYHYKELNSLFAVAILAYLFFFHILFSSTLIHLYHLFTVVDFFLFRMILVLVLFLIIPITLYFLLMIGINYLLKRWMNNEAKENETSLALEEMTKAQTTLKNRLSEQTSIPMYYLKTYALNKFETYFLHQRADSLKEAINLFEVEQQHVLQQYRFYRYHGEKRFSAMYEKAAEFENQVT
ncbi:hypothetical protein ABC345_05150 [Shouchella sp. 1P09AA]|uniref:hypothetical protein n=1 Tax=unclassified Shouchella TaxID=2893065 RepID=UPI0039A009EA